MREEGSAALYKGLVPSVVLSSTHGALQFGAYEALKASPLLGQLSALSGTVTGTTDIPAGGSSAAIFLLAGLSKMIAATLTYPVSTIRSRVQQRPAGAVYAYSGLWATGLRIWRTEGVRGYFKGLTVNLVRVTPHSSILLLLYERVLQATLAAQDSWK